MMVVHNKPLINIRGKYEIEDWRRLAARETDEGEENPIFNAFNSPSLSTPKFARVDPLNPWTRIQLVPTWNYGFVTTWGQHLCML